ncbi:MAG: Cyd operon protein YbgE [Bradyrhizobium sp.]|nr:MAG: Cyd operon protein YbgE [Bradyrhizobium sp.]
MPSVKSMITGARRERATALARAIQAASFAAALLASLALMLFPFLLRQVPETRLHAALPFMLLGVAGAFVHGVGFSPDNRLLRLLFGPACAWTLMVGGALLMLAP